MLNTSPVLIPPKTRSW